MPDLTILSGQLASPTVQASDLGLKPFFGSLVSLIIVAPDTLPETITLAVSAKKAPSASDLQVLSIGGTDITIPAGKATEVPVGGIRSFRLEAGGATAANRVFQVSAQLDV